MSKRQCEVDCDSKTNSITSGNLTNNMYSPKKRNGLSCSRSFRDAKDVEVPSDGPTKIKRPATICLPQCNKPRKSPSTSPPLVAICAKISPSSAGDGPTRINEFIYLGSQIDASSESIKKHGITRVLNVTANLPKCQHVSDSNFLRISVNDGHYDQLLPHFNEVFQFIDETKMLGGSVLVHCMAGVSRSATLVIAYLMHRDKLSFNEAYRYVKQKRPNVAPNFNFLGQLMEFEAYLRLLKRSQESNSSAIAQQSLSPVQPTTNHAALGSNPTDGSDAYANPHDVTAPHHHHHHQDDNSLSFKCLQQHSQEHCPSKLTIKDRLSPSEDFLNDIRYRCRTNSINQALGSPSSISSHEGSEILQVS